MRFGGLRVLFTVGGGAGPGAAEVEFFGIFSNVAKSHEMMGDAQKCALEHILRSNARKFIHFVFLWASSTEGIQSGALPARGRLRVIVNYWLKRLKHE